MPVYDYEALLENGKSIKGIIEAESAAVARTRLRGEGRYPINISEAGVRSTAFAGNKAKQWLLFERIRSDEVHLLVRQLATMLGAGIPLDAALAGIVEQIANPALKKVVAQLREAVSEGEPLSRAMQRFERLFSNMYINMVRAGEASGNLDRVLARLADHGEKQQMLLMRLRSAMVYPLFMAVVGGGILFVLIAYIVPTITEVFSDMEEALPFSTLLLIKISSLLHAWWWLLLVVIVAMWLGGKAAIGRPWGKSLWDIFKLRLPIFGPLLRKVAAARFASTMASLLDGGVEIIAALEIAKRIIDNSQVSVTIDRAIGEINRGRSMAGALSGASWFAPMFVQMVAVGEASGTLEEMFSKIVVAGERDVEAAVLGLTALIEPVMIVVMGGVVGFIVLSILLPIFEMNQMVG